MGRYSLGQIQGYLANQLEKQKLFSSEPFEDGVRIRLTGGPVVGSVTIHPSWLELENEVQLLGILDAALREALSATSSQAILRSKGRDAKKV